MVVMTGTWCGKPTKCKVLTDFVVNGGADEVGEDYTSCDGEVFCKGGFLVLANVLVGTAWPSRANVGS